MRFRLQITALGVVLALFLSTRAHAQSVLDQVPGDAIVVVKLKNLNQVSRKVAKVAKELGLDQMEPKLADPIGALEQEIHLNKGVNKDGDLAFVFIDPDAVGGNPEKAMLFLIPVTDYNAFVGNFKNPKTEGAITQAEPPEGGNADIFLAKWGNYAAMTPNKEMLGKKPTGMKLPPAAAKEADAKDVLAYVNMAAVKAKALPALKQAKPEAMKEIENALGMAGDVGKKFAPVVRALADQVFAYGERFLGDTRSVTLGLGLSDAGLVSTFMIDFEPTSYFGGIISQVKSTNQPLTTGLPNRKFLMFGGSTSDPKVAAKVFGDFFDPIIKELANVPEGKAIADIVNATKKSTAATTSTTFGLVVPTGGLGKESLVQEVIVMHGDAPAIQAANRQTLQAMADLMKLLPQQKEMSTSFEVKPAAKTVAGAQLDTFETKMKLDENDPQAAQVKQIMSWVYGPTGNSGVMGAVDAKTFIMVSGGSDQLVADTVISAKAGTAAEAGNTAGVRSVAAQLPKNRTGEFYIDLASIVGTGLRYAKDLGLPINVKIAPDLPPIGAAVAADQSAVRLDSFISLDLVKGLVAAGMQAQKEMQKPGGGLE